ncbi:MAG: isoprenylcysteine carboxylmethyltransferase family protein [candidate division WOR-3 bacterium]
MDSTKIISIIYISTFFLVLLINTIFQLKTGKNNLFNFSMKNKDGVYSLIIFSFTNIWFVEIFRNLFFPLNNFIFKNFFNHSVCKIFSAILFLLGIILYIRSLVDLNSEWVVGTNSKKVKQLVKKGIYSYTRNPIYIFFMIFYFSIFLLFGSIEMFLFFLVATIIFYRIILIEEKELEEKFKDEYLNYKKKVKRFV